MKRQAVQSAFCAISGFTTKSSILLPAVSKTAIPPYYHARQHALNRRTLSVGIIGYPVRSFKLPNIYGFDKVPKKLPDWWKDEDDDEDDDNDENKDEDKMNNTTMANMNSASSSTSSSSSFNPENQTVLSGSGGGNDFSGGGDGRDGRKGGGGGGDGSGEAGGDSNKGGQGLFAMMIAWYTKMLTTHPIRTKAISTSVLAIIGDFIAQYIAHRGSNASSFSWDSTRTGAIGLWGLFFMGPVLHSWYSILGNLVSGKFSVFRKVIIDQLCFAPVFNSAFMFGTGMLEGRKFRSVTKTWSAKFKDSMIANWMLWPFAQAINFALIPKPYQVMFVNFVALGWNVVLTYISHDHGDEAENEINITEKHNGLFGTLMSAEQHEKTR